MSCIKQTRGRVPAWPGQPASAHGTSTRWPCGTVGPRVPEAWEHWDPAPSFFPIPASASQEVAEGSEPQSSLGRAGTTGATSGALSGGVLGGVGEEGQPCGGEGGPTTPRKQPWVCPGVCGQEGTALGGPVAQPPRPTLCSDPEGRWSFPLVALKTLPSDRFKQNSSRSPCPRPPVADILSCWCLQMCSYVQ